MGYLSFHDIQNRIFQFRQDRIRNYKLVYPNLVSKQTLRSLPTQQLNKSARTGRVSSSVAPSTMFQRMKGNTNPDIIKQVSLFIFLLIYMIDIIDIIYFYYLDFFIFK